MILVEIFESWRRKPLWPLAALAFSFVAVFCWPMISPCYESRASLLLPVTVDLERIDGRTLDARRQETYLITQISILRSEMILDGALSSEEGAPFAARREEYIGALNTMRHPFDAVVELAMRTRDDSCQPILQQTIASYSRWLNQTLTREASMALRAVEDRLEAREQEEEDDAASTEDEEVVVEELLRQRTRLQIHCERLKEVRPEVLASASSPRSAYPLPIQFGRALVTGLVLALSLAWVRIRRR